MAWYDVVIAFDTETTGLKSDAEIVELGVVHYYKGKKVREWSSFFCPRFADRNNPDVQKAMQVNGIDWDKLLTHAPTFRKMAEAVEAEMSEAVWVAHNADFDVRMLRQEFARLERPMAFQPELVLCTKNLDFVLSPGQAGYKLENVAKRWGVVQDGAHRAIVDAQACGDVLAKMIESGKLPEDPLQAQTLVKEGDAKWRSRPKGVW